MYIGEISKPTVDLSELKTRFVERTAESVTAVKTVADLVEFSAESRRRYAKNKKLPTILVDNDANDEISSTEYVLAESAFTKASPTENRQIKDSLPMEEREQASAKKIIDIEV